MHLTCWSPMGNDVLLFVQAATAFHVPSSNAHGLQLPHILTNTCWVLMMAALFCFLFMLRSEKAGL